MLYKKTFASATQSRLPPVPGWGETADHFAAPLCQQCTVLSLIWRIWILFLNSIQELLAPILGWRPSCHEIIWSKLRYEPSRWTGGQAFAVQIYAWPQDMTQSIRFSSNFVTCLMANVMHSSHVALKKNARTLASSGYLAWQVSALSWSCADRNGCMLGWDLLGSYRECGATFYNFNAEWNHPVSRVKSSLRDSGGAWNLELLAWFEGMKHCSNGFYDDFPVQNPRANWNVGAEVWTRTNEDDWRSYSFVIGLSMFVLLAME